MTRSWFKPMDAAGLAAFRVLFGAVLAWEASRYLLSSWIHDYWIEPSFHFTYPGFAWVQPLPPAGMYALVAGLFVAGVAASIGLFSRAAFVVCGLGWTYLFLLDQMTYLNHMYLICVLCGLMAVAPAHRTWAVGTWLQPSRAVGAVPTWGPRLLSGYVALVYFWAGVAKINPDWLRAQPMTMWMERRRDLPVVGELLAADATAWFLSYGGLLFDLAVGPMLLARRTRPLILPVVFAFHLTNSVVFDIGVFPWMMMGACVLFVDPQWIRDRLARFGAHLRMPGPAAPPASRGARRATVAFITAFVAVQVALPLRHHLYPGNPSWSEEGHLFAWHMKLRSKKARLRYKVVDPGSGRQWSINPTDHLSERQARKIKTRPDLIWLYAQHIAEQKAAEGFPDVQVFADSKAGLNGRPYQRYIDPDVDLTTVDRCVWTHADWILPMEDALPDTPVAGGGDDD